MASTSDIPTEIAPEEAAKLLDAAEAVLLDCRTPEEREFARIERSRFVPMQEVPSRLDELAPYREQTLIVYCHHGVRSLRVATFLRDRGFDRAASLAGGIDRWSVEIDPSVSRY